MRTRELTVIRDASDIPEVFAKDICEQRRPGFQVAPEVPLDETIDTLQDVMHRLGYEGYFAVDLSSLHVPGDTELHIDENQVANAAGLAIHHNIAGMGKVLLRSARLGLRQTPFDRLAAIKMRLASRGPFFEGLLQPGMKTVFSEGFIAASGLAHLGPAQHFFLSDGDYRAWERYTIAPRHSTAESDPLLI